MRILLALSLWVAFAGGAFAEEPAAAPTVATVIEPSTEQAFPVERTVAGHKLMLLGTGVRKKFIVKVYAMALYVDETEARRNFSALAARAGGSSRARLLSGDAAPQFAVWGAFMKLGVLHFVRDVDAEKIRDAFREGLEDELSDRAAPEMKKSAEAFLALFDRELKEGQEIWIRTDGDGHITVEIAGDKKDGPSSAKLARAVWNIWLGAKPISPELRRGLIDRVDLLGK